jgi:hypothetical protein
VSDPTPIRRAAAVLSAVLPIVLAPWTASAAQVWTALATEKIRPSASARADASAQLSAARNEFEAFQVVVTGNAADVRATASDLVGPATIGGVRLYREATMNLANASALDGGTGPWPDALVPDVDEIVGEKRNAFPFQIGDGGSHAIWVEVLVPPNAPAGDYHGQVHVTWTGGDATIPVTLTVWPFTLPSTASLKSAFLFTYGAIPTAHGLSGDAFYQLRQRYGAFALDHRISLTNHDDGEWKDLSHFDQYYGPLMGGTGPTQLQGARLTSLQYLGDDADATWMGQWFQHGTSPGWNDRQFQYTCDEPPGGTCGWSDIAPRAANARALGLRTLVTTTVQQADQAGVTSSIDLLVPVINYLDDKPGNTFSGNQRAAYDAFLAASPRHELWAYQSCMSHGCGGTVNFGNPSADDQYYTGWPSYMIDASAVRNRAMQWLAFRYKLSGELYWETAYALAQGDAWTSQWYFTGNGDGTLFYPGKPAVIGGTTDIPVASIRLKMIREGMEDYEYLKLLSDLGDAPLAHQIADGLFPTASSTEQSPQALMAARAQIAQRIIALTGGKDPSPMSPGSQGSQQASAPSTATPGGCASGGAAPGLLALAGLACAARMRRRSARRR